MKDKRLTMEWSRMPRSDDSMTAEATPGHVCSNEGLGVTAPRVVCQFSCGAASAVATKLALAEHGDRCVILNAYIEEEHEDNRRFAADCERWFGRAIVTLRDTKYNASAVQVFETVGYMVGMALLAPPGSSADCCVLLSSPAMCWCSATRQKNSGALTTGARTGPTAPSSPR